MYDMATLQNMTVMMIAHRLETAVTYSDKILVMDKGSVAEFE
jgi:ABC-type multidrug transport system fused ATPase/permease subunit